MKKYFLYILVFTITIAFFGNMSAAYAWDDCPKGEVNDPYPGDCSRYIDTDGDGICDHSEPAPEDRETTTTESSDTSSGTYTAIPAIETTTSNSVSTSSKTTSTQNSNSQTKATSNSKYNFWIIFVSLLVLYLVSYALSKTKVMSTVLHRKIWNILLLVTFLASGLIGILLTIRIENPSLLTLPQNFLFLHVEFGIAMALISIFHIIWHWPYFKCLLKIKKSDDKNCD